jgi:peroxiredoxin
LFGKKGYKCSQRYTKAGKMEEMQEIWGMKRTMTKRLLPLVYLITVWCLGVQPVEAQATDSLPLYQKFPFVPSFKLLKTDGTTFTTTDVLPKKKAAVIIVFSPTCGHCQHQAEEITSHMKQLGDASFLFVTNYPLADIKQFSDAFGLSRFPNIRLGQDTGMNLITFYKLRGLPGVFVYNKKGDFVQSFNTNVSAEEIVTALGK